MGVVKHWNEARGAAVITECGTGKILISLGAVHVHSDRKPFTALAMVPRQLVEKRAEKQLTTPSCMFTIRPFSAEPDRSPAALCE